MRDDFAWIIEGRSRFSRNYEGKEAVKRDLLTPLFEAFATPYRFTIDEIIAEGDRVVLRGLRRGGRPRPPRITTTTTASC